MSDAYDAMIRNALKKAQDKHGLGEAAECFAVVKAVIETESSFRPDADKNPGVDPTKLRPGKPLTIPPL